VIGTVEKGGRRTSGKELAWHEPGRIPIVTVALVVRNAADCLEQTLQSVFDQDYRNLEIIVVDGSSEDGTLDILRRHEDRLDLFVSEPDEGIYQAMNKAGDLAGGEYLNFMNAGDSFVADDTVRSVFDGLAGRPDLVFGDAYVIEDGERHLVTTDENIEENLYQRTPFCHQSLFTRTPTFRRYRFNTEYRIVADYDFILRCFKGGCSFRHVAVPVANYVLGGFTKRNQERGAHEFLKSLHDNGFDEGRIRESSFLRGIARRSATGQRKDATIRRQAEKIKAQIERIKAQAERIKAQAEKIKAQAEKIKAQAEKIKAKNDVIEKLRGRLKGPE